ncbi:MAG: ACT domain-containing protein [Planctomycetes bacterium]|nr:ACT domain-containing protein [Planctomycetota bacterium]
MQTRKQVTVFLENKPGRLAQVLSRLAHAKINIVALSVMDRHEHGVLRLVTEDEAATAKELQALNAHFTESDVLAVELKNQPGALAHICERLAEEHISIEYAYCSSGGRNGRVFGIFKVSNLDKAQRILNESPKNQRKVEKPTLRDQRAYRR